MMVWNPHLILPRFLDVLPLMLDANSVEHILAAILDLPMYLLGLERGLLGVEFQQFLDKNDIYGSGAQSGTSKHGGLQQRRQNRREGGTASVASRSVASKKVTKGGRSIASTQRTTDSGGGDQSRPETALALLDEGFMGAMSEDTQDATNLAALHRFLSDTTSSRRIGPYGILDARPRCHRPRFLTYTIQNDPSNEFYLRKSGARVFVRIVAYRSTGRFAHLNFNHFALFFSSIGYKSRFFPEQKFRSHVAFGFLELFIDVFLVCSGIVGELGGVDVERFRIRSEERSE
eukprot:TRINITY_DN31369_c0_g1_i1.p2 TRINITY_DN31369_c0_g1~~TRINITY_DN31369_c0_g1_i1.p2  ORF type:complete len:289 (-),score=39.75 TRINITY_DN31369_c0_g1_i1:474-1340(-)